VAIKLEENTGKNAMTGNRVIRLSLNILRSCQHVSTGRCVGSSVPVKIKKKHQNTAGHPGKMTKNKSPGNDIKWHD
jgi:hypothetical protein